MSLVLFRLRLKLLIRKDRTVLAHELVSYVTPATLSDAALHSHLEGEKNILGGEAEFGDDWQSELYHHRWATDD